MTTYTIHWDHGSADIQSLGGMLGPALFRLTGAKVVQPFAIGPWADDGDARHANLPGIMQRLRGEWPCVPFGAPSPPPELPVHWRGISNPVDAEFHGYAAHHHWSVLEQSAGTLVLGIDYPSPHPIRSLRRTVSGVAGKPELACTLEIAARKQVNTTLALHPTFALSTHPGQTQIDLGPFAFAHTFPISFEAGVSRLQADKAFAELDKAPTHKGGSLDLTRLPLAFDTEELVQVCGLRGPVCLHNLSEGYTVKLEYDQTLFDSLLLWVSNRGRTSYPWSGRFTALGMEPVCGAFDLGPEVGGWQDNPLARRGIRTALMLAAGETLTTHYRIGVAPLTQASG